MSRRGTMENRRGPLLCVQVALGERQARVEGTNRERANVRALDRRRDAAPRCLISASGASEALRQRRPIGEPRTSDDSAHCESPVALFLVTTTDHSPYANVHGASSRSSSRLPYGSPRDDSPLISRLFLRRESRPALLNISGLLYSYLPFSLPRSRSRSADSRSRQSIHERDTAKKKPRENRENQPVSGRRASAIYR